MAENTPVSLRNQVMYCVYVRNHTPEGTFKALSEPTQPKKKTVTERAWFNKFGSNAD